MTTVYAAGARQLDPTSVVYVAVGICAREKC